MKGRPIKNIKPPERGRFLRISPEGRRKMWRRTRTAIYVLVAVLVLALMFGGKFGIISRIRYDRFEKSLELQLETEKARNDSLKIVLNRLKTDPDYLERMTRERLRMIKENEKIYRFRED